MSISKEKNRRNKTRLRSKAHVVRRDIRIYKVSVSGTKFYTGILKRACSVKLWCTKITRILRIVVQTGANLAVL